MYGGLLVQVVLWIVALALTAWRLEKTSRT
jgi:hypothetical protein